MAIDPKRGAGSAAALPRGWGLSTTQAWCREGLRHATAGSAATSTLALRALGERGLHAPQRPHSEGTVPGSPGRGPAAQHLHPAQVWELETRGLQEGSCVNSSPIAALLSAAQPRQGGNFKGQRPVCDMLFI